MKCEIEDHACIPRAQKFYKFQVWNCELFSINQCKEQSAFIVVQRGDAAVLGGLFDCIVKLEKKYVVKFKYRN